MSLGYRLLLTVFNDVLNTFSLCFNTNSIINFQVLWRDHSSERNDKIILTKGSFGFQYSLHLTLSKILLKSESISRIPCVYLSDILLLYGVMKKSIFFCNSSIGIKSKLSFCSAIEIDVVFILGPVYSSSGIYSNDGRLKK